MNRSLARFGLLTALTAVLALSPRAAAEEELSVQLYKKNVNSIVVIYALTTQKVGNQIVTSGGRGSGSLIDAKQRLILTNWHVVQELPTVRVDFPIPLKDGTIFRDPEKYKERAMKGQAIRGVVLHRDKSRDLALVKLDSLPSHAKALPLARKSPQNGERTWNLGSPGAVAQLFGITMGEVRGVGPGSLIVSSGGPDAEAFEVKATVVTATNPTNPGDSGGPLFDKRGYQVAVTQSGNTGAQRVNSFIDVTEVRTFLAEKDIVIEELTPEEEGAFVPPPKPKKVIGGPAKGTTPAVTQSADEKAAASMLSRAKAFSEGDDNRPAYIERLKEIVKKYPDTPAGKEAARTLKSLQK